MINYMIKKFNEVKENVRSMVTEANSMNLDERIRMEKSMIAVQNGINFLF